MSKRTIKAHIFNDFYEIITTSNTFDKKHIHNIVKRILARRLKKKNISLNDYVKNNENIKLCRNCNNISLYDFDYEIKIKGDVINYNTKKIKYEKYESYEKLYCGQCLKQYNANSKKYVSIVYGISENEANDIILKRNKSPFYRTNFNSDEEYKKNQSRNVNFYIKKYGNKGKEIYNNHIKKWQDASNNIEHRAKKDSMSLKFNVNKYGIEEGINKFNQRKKDTNNSLKSLIEKYGEKTGWEKYKNKIQKLSYNNSKESYIERYGKNEGIKKYNNWIKKCTISSDLMVKKYDKKEGEKRYKKWLIGITSNNKITYSKESKNFFDLLTSMFQKLTLVYGKDELFIYDNVNNFQGQKIFFYDCYIKELNLIIEYDTPTYHPSPLYLSLEEIKKSRGGCFEKDLYKEKLAKEHNYNFYRVYIKNNKDKIIELEKLIKYINENK